MTRRVLVGTAIGVALASTGLLVEHRNSVIWNRTGSAPIGLYRLGDEPLRLGRWGVVSAGSEEALWAAARGYVGRDWPLLKQIAALPGAEVCRRGDLIEIDGRQVAQAMARDSSGRLMPVWSGCFTLSADEVFLLNPHPASLDGRYFGAMQTQDIEGVAILIFSVQG